MTAPVPTRATRRGTLAVALVALIGSGCDVVTPAPTPDANPDPTTGPRAAPETPVDPDEALVAEVRADLVAASLLISSALGVRAGLRAELAPFATLHARHLVVLDVDRPRGRTRVRGSASEVRALVRTREARLQGSLATAAVAADSGALAALLASMSAAVAQQLADGQSEPGVSG